ncbi:MAG: SPOR domain-containing protein [Treponema sp.]|nr:SPOR domain-containing protein [Treponema sp.]
MRNSLYINELAIFSEEPLKTQPGFSEVPIAGGKKTVRFPRILAVCILWVAVPGPLVPGQSLGAEIQNIENTLSRPGLSAADRRNALIRLARLQELSGGIEAAARNWGEAAAAEPDKPDDLSLIRGAWCFAAMGEWDRAGAAVRTILLAGRPGPALLRAQYLGALIAALGSANFSTLKSLADKPGFETFRPSIYYTLWRTLDPAGEGALWKSRLLAEFPLSPEGRIAAAEDTGVSAAPTPMWLLFPGREPLALTSAPAEPPARPVPASAPPVTETVLLQTGLFGNERNAENQADRLRAAGFSPRITRRTVNGNEYWAAGVSPGQDMNQMILRLKNAGFESFPVY